MTKLIYQSSTVISPLTASHLKNEITHLAQLCQTFLEALDIFLSDHDEPFFPSA